MPEGLLTERIPYFPDSAVLFERISALPGAVFLDSGNCRGGLDFFAAQPEIFLVSHNSRTKVWRNGIAKIWHDQDPIVLLASLLDPPLPQAELPFLTGAIGFVSYDYGRCLEKMPNLATDTQQLPDMAFGIYDWVVVVDHHERMAVLLGLPGASEKRFNQARRLLKKIGSRAYSSPFMARAELRSNMSREEYLRKFDAVMKYIREGDCYQVNLAQKFSIEVSGDAWLAYRKLRELSPAPYSAYLNCGTLELLCVSPEKFLSSRSGNVTTSPIKGTRPRFKDEALDTAALRELQNSEKDRAENLMIVDLLRNDVSKSCCYGSVKVHDLFKLESYANVHHLVSTVKGRLAPQKNVFDLLLGCFPGGSVTGAPKVRAMEIIEELEPHRRGVYCGAIGYFSRCGGMEFNIAIRTAVHKNGEFVFYGGGGLVADSNGPAEYQETLDKVSPFFHLLGRSAEKFLDGQGK